MRRYLVSATQSRASNLKALLQLSGVDASQIAKKFATRLESQKKVFLLQLHPSMSNLLGYSFNMYIRGPYSPTLAGAYYDLDKVTPANIRLDDSARTYVTEISALDNWKLELLATTFSVLEYGKGVHDDSIIARISDLKPKYSRDEIARAIVNAGELIARYDLRF